MQTYRCNKLGMFPNTPSETVANSLSCNSLEKKENAFIIIAELTIDPHMNWQYVNADVQITVNSTLLQIINIRLNFLEASSEIKTIHFYLFVTNLYRINSFWI